MSDLNIVHIPPGQHGWAEPGALGRWVTHEALRAAGWVPAQELVSLADVANIALAYLKGRPDNFGRRDEASVIEHLQRGLGERLDEAAYKGCEQPHS